MSIVMIVLLVRWAIKVTHHRCVVVDTRSSSRLLNLTCICSYNHDSIWILSADILLPRRSYESTRYW